MRHWLSGVVAVGLAFATVTVFGQAQGRGGGGEFTNLQVLPSDMAQPELIEIMRGFRAALGVDCSHCHVWIGPQNPGNDMASDAKAPKRVARVMMAVTMDINERLVAEVGKPADQITRVQCITCHRGSTIPTIEVAGTN